MLWWGGTLQIFAGSRLMSTGDIVYLTIAAVLVLWIIKTR